MWPRNLNNVVLRASFRSSSGISAMNSDTINARLHIALNGGGTAHFDPRSAVVHFLKSKERRKRVPTVEIYAQRDFFKKLLQKVLSFFSSLQSS